MEYDLKFDSSYTKTDGCWEWHQSKDKDGYGIFYAFGETYRAHRYAAERAWGLPLSNHCALHKCDTPSCVNPDHLWWGTQAENIRDRHEKGRSRNRATPGMAHHMVKLTDAEVFKIKNDTRKLREIADEYKISEAQVSRIRNGKSWKHLDNHT